MSTGRGIEWGELEQALRTHGAATWSASDRESYVDELLESEGDFAGMTASGVAHIAWTMGASWPHEGYCRNADPEAGSDADYSNACEACESALTTMGHKVIEALA